MDHNADIGEINREIAWLRARYASFAWQIAERERRPRELHGHTAQWNEGPSPSHFY